MEELRRAPVVSETSTIRHSRHLQGRLPLIKRWWTYSKLVYYIWRSHSHVVFLRILRYYLRAELTGEWEPWLWNYVPKIGRTAIDAGANKGQWSFKLAKGFAKVI